MILIHYAQVDEMKIKRRLFIKICEMLKVPEGCMAPSWLTWLFYPLLKYASDHSRMRYDFMRDIFIIGTIKYSGEIFRMWDKNGFPEGKLFKIVSRDDGVLVIKEYLTPPDHNHRVESMRESRCPECNEIEPVLCCENCGHKWPRTTHP